MSPLLVNNIGLTIAGVATLLVPLCSTHELLIAYCIVWGGAIGKFSQCICFYQCIILLYD
jgi:hypothetical protein